MNPNQQLQKNGLIQFLKIIMLNRKNIGCMYLYYRLPFNEMLENINLTCLAA